jgi:hypothetical protein
LSESASSVRVVRQLRCRSGSWWIFSYSELKMSLTLADMALIAKSEARIYIGKDRNGK